LAARLVSPMPIKKLSLKISRAERLRVQRATMQGLRPAEERYVKALRGISRGWSKAYMKMLEPVVAARFDAKGDPLPSSFHALGVRIDVVIEKQMGPLFDKMAKEVSKANAKQASVIGITPQATGLTELIAKRRAENIELVKKAHARFRGQAEALLTDPENFGMRSETLAARLAELADVSESRAEVIARDQTLTLNGQITEERQTSAGIERYTWSTSLDERVRDEHAALEGEVISWDEPPAVGHPGADVLCRCVALAVVEELEGLF
jgi:SPP1 gp7 family putative phage head morphogenesis protein